MIINLSNFSSQTKKCTNFVAVIFKVIDAKGGKIFGSDIFRYQFIIFQTMPKLIFTIECSLLQKVTEISGYAYFIPGEPPARSARPSQIFCKIQVRQHCLFVLPLRYSAWDKK